MAAESWELRTARLEGAYEQVDRRLGAVESRLSTLEQKMDVGFAQVHAEIHDEVGSLRSEMHGQFAQVHGEMQRQFYWFLGAVGGMLAVMISGFLQLALRLGGH